MKYRNTFNVLIGEHLSRFYVVGMSLFYSVKLYSNFNEIPQHHLNRNIMINLAIAFIILILIFSLSTYFMIFLCVIYYVYRMNLCTVELNPFASC